MLRPIVAAIVFGAAAAVQPAQAADPDLSLTIDDLVKKGIATAGDRAAFTANFLDSCRAEQPKNPVNIEKQLTAEQIEAYCKCNAEAAAGVITLGDIDLIGKAGGEMPPEIAAKLAVIGKNCAP